jgi:hypothetical protein
MHPPVVVILLVVREVYATPIIRKIAKMMASALVLQLHHLIHLPHQHQPQPLHLVEMQSAAGVAGVMPALVEAILQVEAVLCATLIGQNHAKLMAIALPSQLQPRHHLQCLHQVL